MEEQEEPVRGSTTELIAYRLGRVEKAVDQINTHSIDRDNKIMDKLEQLGEIAQRVSQATWRIESLELSRTRTYQFMAGLGAAVVLMVLDKIFNMF